MASTTNGPLFDLQYLSYIGDLKARNKMCLRPIDIAKMHGYKDCVNYLATLEACLSLAEQNVALETELLHYGAELSELEKCFNELLQLTKSERLQAQSSYFNSVVEAIERKWKRCKSKSLGSHGLPDQSAYNLFQSHFSRVLTDDVLSELSFSSSPSNHLHHQSFFQQHLHNRFSNHRHHNHPTIDAHRLKSNPGADNLTSLLTGDRTTVKNKCNSSGYTPTYSDPFLELSNGHYSLFSSDTDYAVPYKLKTGPKNKAGVKKSDNPVILGRRGLKQQRDQPEGSSVPSYPKSSSSLYESYKDHHNHHREPSSSASSPPSASRHGKGDFEDIDLDLDLDDEDDDELSGYSSPSVDLVESE
ncbi:uncharacterized protein LOC128391974 [Panonychus citri]|uniref:uncharacterized protein LOC128391974 n=1 Tax=Panonychus citri TaxID=50023 RepID=UPI002307BC0F|nr:uncharacterized protein LOC128391974 [Panonychus citri]